MVVVRCSLCHGRLSSGSREVLPGAPLAVPSERKPSYNEDYYDDGEFDDDEYDPNERPGARPPAAAEPMPQYQPPSQQQPQYSPPAVPPTRFVTGESHQMPPAQFVDLDSQKKSVAGTAPDTFV